MNKKYYVYEWIRLDTNEPFYIGKGSGNRWCLLTRGSNFHFNNIVKYKDVAVVILEDNLDEKTAYEYECYYIEYYRDLGFNLANISDGGENPPCFSGDKNGNYGNYWTDEQKERMRKKMLNKYDGKDNPKAKPIMCLETGEVFDCILDAQCKYNINTYSSLTIALNDSKGRTASGYHWSFITEDNEETLMNPNSRFYYLLECYKQNGDKKYYIDVNTKVIYNRKQIREKELISDRKFKSFISTTNKYMLIDEFLQSHHIVMCG